MDSCCDAKGEELASLAQGGRRRVLVWVLAINLVMFVVELSAGIAAHSTALMADSIDMLGDALVYILSLYVVAKGPRWKAGAALAKGIVIFVFGVWVLGEVVHKLMFSVVPTSSLMALFGAIALAANLTCMTLLSRYRDEDINMASTFECSRNDVISNVGAILAAAAVWATGRAWPDILVGAIVGTLFFRSAIGVIRDAWPQVRTPAPTSSVSAAR